MSKYQAYLQTPEWKARRMFKLKEAQFRCQLCGIGKTTLNVHHRDYETLGDENPWDLTVLCRRCHDDFHKLQKLRKQPELEDESLSEVVNYLVVEGREEFETRINQNIWIALESVLPPEKLIDVSMPFRVLDGTDFWKEDEHAKQRAFWLKNLINTIRGLSEEQLATVYKRLWAK